MLRVKPPPQLGTGNIAFATTVAFNESSILNNYWIFMKLCPDIHVPQMMPQSDFGGSLEFPLVSLAAQSSHLSSESLDN